MTVAAPPLDTAGALLLTGIAAAQALVTANANPAAQSSCVQQLNALQIQAVDHFMATYWVSADSILAALPPAPTGRYGTIITAQLAAIAARAAAVVILVANGLPQINNAQYSVAYLPYQVPDTFWYQLNTQLVDFLMQTSTIPASLILSTMTGTQTYPFNYVSGYTTFQSDIES